MKAVLIDPFKREVRSCEVSDPKATGDYGAFNGELYALLSSGPVDVDTFEAVHLSEQPGDCVLVDGEGLFKDFDKQRFFLIAGAYAPLAGIGIALGSDRFGDSCEPKLGEEWFRSRVEFMDCAQARAFCKRRPEF